MSTVVTTRSANAEFGSQFVRQKIDSGRWQRVARGVLVTHNGSLSDAERDLVALAAAPPGSALAGLTALRLDGFDSPETTTRFVVMPPGSRTHQIAGVVAHWSSELSDLDVHPHRRPTRTRPARSVVDAVGRVVTAA